jgi:NAD-dependent SIR2 family protein deacetylase
MIKNTKNIDDVECIYCHHKWNGDEATNYDTSTSIITCPKCNKEMGVMQSVEYECHEIEE